MTFYHGKNTEIWVNGADLSTYFRNADFGVDVDTADTTTFKSSWRSAVAGQAKATYELEGLYDTSVATTMKNLLPTSTSVLTVGPAGMTAVGDTARLVSVHATSYKESAPVGDVVAFNWSVESRTDVGLGVVLIPLTTFTQDTNGSTHTGPIGGTTTGAIAHLHVTSVSTDDTVDVTVEHSTNGTDWSTLGTFAQKAAAGAERLVIAGTVNRYTRAVVNVTGTDVSIALAVALART